MQKIKIKNQTEIKFMRTAGKLAFEVLNMIEQYLKPNISTEDINQICHNYIVNQQKAIPACLGYNGFPKSICTSINDVVCHGIPNEKDIIQNGDIINIDIAIIKNGYYGDTSKMFLIGKTSLLSQQICQAAQESLLQSIKIIKPGIQLSEIGKSIQKYIKKKNFSIVKEYCGHGIGSSFHEAPYVLHYYEKYHPKIILQEGMIFTIEPMINAGSSEVYCSPHDKWTVRTKDKSLSAQYEHTILVTKKGYEILTN
ncbi:type I methionyl aminopeptidase [Buchnera aphidicola (Thelaxes californica)]|uniref:Methionine aminopeptidase n=1 Tax=Buchnera aphidicola (Thelaxes californica) TaxID=1315998 RepID=A0A4D6YLZ4_9GAMM|nr:type I methionyl aminopeptidase [Buchnera aphidicola]QCI26718.1 type I methionyl aminopeptidase [Buchnera aphidicola (Thelaxes californica)]